jgi:histidine ammonia-lyase
MRLRIETGSISLGALRDSLREPTDVVIDSGNLERIAAAQRSVARIVASERVTYGINTGFGLLAQKSISREQLKDLQRNLLLSHAAGSGDPLPDDVVRLILVLKIISLARGFSGVRLLIVEALAAMLRHEVYPLVPAKGSVGASGDLAPLAHLGGVLLGIGNVRHRGRVLSASEGLQIIGLEPIVLDAKEGLALINGTQVSTALALASLFAIEDVFAAAVLAGAMSIDAFKGSDVPLDERIHAARGQPGQSVIAKVYKQLLAGSEIRLSHVDCSRVQDPYSLRCQPQVMGACLDLLANAARTLAIEANAATDNPLIFAAQDEVLSGGNFHAEPVAFAADILAIAICEVGNLSERRIALLVDPKMSGLPPFLIEESGINSGFMIAQVTAAALASENKLLAHPASVDSIPTSANQEDHVSMATHGARRLLDMAKNAATIVGIELLTASQGIDFHKPLRTSAALGEAKDVLRAAVPFYSRDRFMAPDIAWPSEWVTKGGARQFVKDFLPSTSTLSDRASAPTAC